MAPVPVTAEAQATVDRLEGVLRSDAAIKAAILGQMTATSGRFFTTH
jgi:hypothetical protein